MTIIWVASFNTPGLGVPPSVYQHMDSLVALDWWTIWESNPIQHLVRCGFSCVEDHHGPLAVIFGVSYEIFTFGVYIPV